MSSRTGAAVAGAIGGSLVTLLLTRAQEARAAGPPLGVDPAVWEMTVSIMETTAVQAGQIDQLTDSLNSLVTAMGGSPSIVGEDPFENTDKFVTGHVVCDQLNFPFQLPNNPIPKNKQLAVKAAPGNVGWIYLAFRAVDSRNASVAYILVPNEGIGLSINNSDQVWVTAPAAPVGFLNDQVIFIVESK